MAPHQDIQDKFCIRLSHLVYHENVGFKNPTFCKRKDKYEDEPPGAAFEPGVGFLLFFFFLPSTYFQLFLTLNYSYFELFLTLNYSYFKTILSHDHFKLFVCSIVLT